MCLLFEDQKYDVLLDLLFSIRNIICLSEILLNTNNLFCIRSIRCYLNSLINIRLLGIIVFIRHNAFLLENCFRIEVLIIIGDHIFHWRIFAYQKHAFLLNIICVIRHAAFYQKYLSLEFLSVMRIIICTRHIFVLEMMCLIRKSNMYVHNYVNTQTNKQIHK